MQNRETNNALIATLVQEKETKTIFSLLAPTAISHLNGPLPDLPEDLDAGNLCENHNETADFSVESDYALG